MSVANSSFRKQSTILYGRKIIVLDDIPELAALFKRALELSGLQVVLTANTGEELLEKLVKIEGGIDYALLDFELKEGLMNGLDTARKLKERDAEIRIILASANEIIQKEVTSKGYIFLKKPISLDELLDSLANYRNY